ncbi:hypothetical protein [Acinetobacter seifertii]|nr:hypothetical protein [Acinetobacter seifertii]
MAEKFINKISFVIKAKLLGSELFYILKEELNGQYEVIYEN